MYSSELPSCSCPRKLSYSSINVSCTTPLYIQVGSTSPSRSSCVEIAVLVDDPTAHRTPSLETLKQWNAERAADAKQQIALAEAKETSEKAAKLAMSEEAIRKRREREERRAAAARAKALAEGEDPNAIEASGPSAPAAASAEQRPSTPSAQTTPAYTVTLPGSSSDLAWYTPEGCTYESIADAQAAGIWTYPADLHERAKCRVFRDLWEKGNFMGGGIKFGGDFLVYPGACSHEFGSRVLTRSGGRGPDAIPLALRRDRC